VPKRVAILRHAKSDWGQPGLSDFDRPLNDRGRSAAKRMGRAIAERDLGFDLILSSPSARTRETLGLIEAEAPVRWEDQLYGADLATLLKTIRALPDDVQSVLFLGHNPGLQLLVMELSRSDPEGRRKRVMEKFPTAALALIDLDVGSWSDIGAGCGEIVELLLPRELD
jgi:phosphohistidine phosphatase